MAQCVQRLDMPIRAMPLLHALHLCSIVRFIGTCLKLDCLAIVTKGAEFGPFGSAFWPSSPSACL